MSQIAQPKPVADALEGALAKLEKAVRLLPPEAREKHGSEADDFTRRQNDSRAATLLAESKAPQRQLNNINIQRSGPWGDTEKKVSGRLGAGFFIALIGSRGCGKTQLAVETIRASVSKGRRARYCTATEFFMEIKAAYSNSARSEKDVVTEFAKPLLLVVDEIGQRSESEWENRLLFELLNRRYNALKDSLLISNQSAEEFQKSMGPSLISRMIETGGLIECNWPSYRK